MNSAHGKKDNFLFAILKVTLFFKAEDRWGINVRVLINKLISVISIFVLVFSLMS